MMDEKKGEVMNGRRKGEKIDGRAGGREKR